jgi:hypothetical protein
MSESQNRIVQVKCFGNPDRLEVVNAGSEHWQTVQFVLKAGKAAL